MIPLPLKFRVEVTPGTNIWLACQSAVDLANKIQVMVVFEFNGTDCFVKPGSSVGRIRETLERDIKGKAKR